MIDTKEQIEIWQGCTHCKNKSTNPNEYPCEECFAFNKYEPMTNADRIRNMTDEELAQFIKCARCDAMYGSTCEQQPYCEGMLGKTCTSVGRIDKGLFKWLQAEVKESDSNAC